MNCNLLRYWGLCHLPAPAIPPKLIPEYLPTFRVPETFSKVPLSAVEGCVSEGFIESSVIGTPPFMRVLECPLQETSGKGLEQRHQCLKRPSVLLQAF